MGSQGSSPVTSQAELPRAHGAHEGHGPALSHLARGTARTFLLSLHMRGTSQIRQVLLLGRILEGHSGQGMYPGSSSRSEHIRHCRRSTEQSQREVKTSVRIFRRLSKSFPFICVTAKQLHYHQKGKPQASYFKKTLCSMGNKPCHCFCRTRCLLSMHLQPRPRAVSQEQAIALCLPASENSLECPQLYSVGYNSTQTALSSALAQKPSE